MYTAPVSRLRTKVVNAALTIFTAPEVAHFRRLWHCDAMRGGTSKAGGIFLTLGVVGGLVAGVATGNAMRGVLLGTIAGIVLALLTWLIDRRRAA